MITGEYRVTLVLDDCIHKEGRRRERLYAPDGLEQ